ncbi:MAG: coenzyme F420-0:L-glutamate ligase [Promethearchaeota archaeon]|nr:MAG: coenzyme F420-0:L-glutamate ligase [Candidatus Lokiarchaeota archaeon]
MNLSLLPIKTPLIKPYDQLIEIIITSIEDSGRALKENDILVISGKIIATSQGRIRQLSTVKDISPKAKDLAQKYEMDERIVELILQESDLILGGMKDVILAQINEILIANAGIDQSNAGIGNVVLFPKDLKKKAWEYWHKFREHYNIENLGIIIADSRVQPLRKGTIGIAIATAGFEPVEDKISQPDLFGRPLKITKRAIADDLTSAAQFLLGEADEQTPLVIIRGAKIQFTDSPQISTELPAEECLYMNIFSKYLLGKDKKLKFE